MLNITMHPATFPDTSAPNLLRLLTGARSLARAIARAVAPTNDFMATDMVGIISRCCVLLGTVRQAAELSSDPEVAIFYMELMNLFRVAHRNSFTELGLRFEAPGIWTADIAQLTSQVCTYPELSRLFIKTFLRQDLEPLVSRWSCLVELH